MTDAVVVVSHARPDGANRLTLRTLADRGVPRELVHVFVAPAEMTEYRAALDPGLYGTLHRGAEGLPGQRRASFRAFPAGAKIVSADDDVADVRRRTGPKTTEPVDDLMGLFARGWAECEAAGATLWGIYPVLNPFFMREGTGVGLHFCVGYLWGAVASRARWAQPTMTCKEDYERTCQRFLHDGAVVRLQDIAARTKWNAKGGIAAQGNVQHRCRREVAELIERYGAWVTITNRRTERGLEIRLRV